MMKNQEYGKKLKMRLRKAEEYTETLYEKKSEFLNGRDIYNDLQPHFANLRCELDQLEHIGFTK